MPLSQDYLRQKYLVEQLSLRQIAAEAGVSAATVRYYMRRYAIPRRTKSEALSGERNPMHGKPKSEEARHKTSETLRQTNLDPEVKTRRSRAVAGEKNPMFGRTHTEGTKEASRQRLAMLRDTPAMKEAHKTAMARPEVREKLSCAASERVGEKNSFYGKTHTPEAKNAISKANTGRFCGEMGSNWKGGVTPLHRAIRNSTKAIAWRKAVFERDNYTCVLCMHRGNQLHADHIVPFSKILRDAQVTTLGQADALSVLWDLSNGRTLCVPCHKQTPTYCGRAVGVSWAMPDPNPWPPLQPGTRVRTVRPDWISSDWTTEALASRRWETVGTVIRHHDSQGLTYEVLHGETVGHYEPRELQVIYPQDHIQRLTPEEARAKRPGYRLPIPLDIDDAQDDLDQTTAEGMMTQDPRPAVRARLRPSNYADLTTREQWAIDKELGLLDWDGR